MIIRFPSRDQMCLLAWQAQIEIEVDAPHFISSFNFLKCQCWNGSINLIVMNKIFTACCIKLLAARLAGLRQNKFTSEGKSPWGYKKLNIIQFCCETFSSYTYMNVICSSQQPLCAHHCCSALSYALQYDLQSFSSPFLADISSLFSCTDKAFHISYS